MLDLPEHSRKTSETNTEKGYIGCNLRIQQKDYSEILIGEEVAEGWVYLGKEPFSKSSGTATEGLMTNYQLITKGISKCKSYE